MLNPNPEQTGRIEVIAPGIEIEWLDDDLLNILHITNFSREAIDQWCDYTVRFREALPVNGATFFCIDATRMTIHNSQYFVKRIIETAKVRPDISNHLVVLFAKTLSAQILISSSRSISHRVANSHWQFVLSREDALKWMRLHYRRWIAKQDGIG